MLNVSQAGLELKNEGGSVKLAIIDIDSLRQVVFMCGGTKASKLIIKNSRTSSFISELESSRARRRALPASMQQ